MLQFTMRSLPPWVVPTIFILCSLLGPIGSVVGQPQSVSETPAEEELAGYEHRFRALGTIVSISAYAHDSTKLARTLAEVEEQVRQHERILSDYRADSETSQLTTSAVESAVPVSETLWQVLSASDQWWQESDGVFDASLGALTRVWRTHRKRDTLPNSAEIEHALRQCGWQNITLDPVRKTIRISQPNVRLDFGAIGKGFIVDKIYERMVEAGYPRCLVNISGNIRCGQAPPGREGWRIEVSGLAKQEQGDSQDALRRISVANTALATSGDLWQFVVIDGKRHSHILDPRTGYGIIGPTAATVLAPTATDADAFATVACIAPWRDSLQIAVEKGYELLFAKRLEGGKITVQETPAFPPALDSQPSAR